MSYREELGAAIDQAKAKLTLEDLMRDRGIVFDRSKNAVCPVCGEKKLHLYRGGFYCWTGSCELSKALKLDAGRDEIGFLAWDRNISRNEAIDLFLRMAEVPNPREKYREGGGGGGVAPPKAAAASSSDPPPQRRKRSIYLPQPADRRNVFQEIHAALSLTEAHRAELKEKRGFSDETIDAAALRSSVPANAGPLAEIFARHRASSLSYHGLLNRKGDRITSILAGYRTIRDEEKRQESGKGVERCDNIIFPYCGFRGEVMWLRPHKDNLSAKGDPLRDPEESMQRVYVALNDCALKDGVCVITEGEFKALALWQCGIPAIGLPGISYVKSFKSQDHSTLDRLCRILRKFDIKRVIIAFDNECKLHKPDPHKRYDADIWAVVTANRIAWRGFEATIAQIPDEWREGTPPKADWDGALARFVREAIDVHDGTKKAAAAFRDVLQRALPPDRFAADGDGEDTERARIIARRVRDLSTVRLIPHGTKRETRLAAWLRRAIPYNSNYRHNLGIEELANALTGTFGCYYIHGKKPEKDERKSLVETARSITKSLDEAGSSEETDFSAEKIAELKAARAACNLLLKGRITIVSKFTMETLYLVTTAATGEFERIIRLVNSDGYTTTPPRPSNSMLTETTRFRNWALGAGPFYWHGNVTHLNQIVEQSDIPATDRHVREVVVGGHDAESGIYFMGDCAFSPDGKILLPDKDHIIWDKNRGYFPPLIDPKIYPNGMPLFLSDGIDLKPGGELPDTEPAAVSEILARAINLFYVATGGYEGVLAFLMVLSWFAAPEMVARITYQPGLWISGRKGSGKTALERWLMRLSGLPPGAKGFSMGKTTTSVGIARALASVSCFPVFCDEFREGDCEPAKLEVIRNAFDRMVGRKGIADFTNRTMVSEPKTTPIVSGETFVADSATASRFASVVLSAERRTGSKRNQRAVYHELEYELSKELFRISRLILTRRKEFAAHVVGEMEAFSKSDAADRIGADRVANAYAASLATLKALVNILPPDRAGAVRAQLEPFEEWLVQEAETANQEIEQENFVELFFQQLMAAVAEPGRTIDRGIMRVGHFNVGSDHKVTEPAFASEGTHRLVIIQSTAAYHVVQRRWKSANDGVFPLSRNSLQKELKMDPAWVEPPDRQPRVHRFGTNQVACWVLDLNKMHRRLADDFWGFSKTPEEETKEKAKADQSDEPL